MQLDAVLSPVVRRLKVNVSMTLQDTPCAPIRAVFGIYQFPDALFYENESALRFDLGGEVSMSQALAARFLQAMDRSRAVAAALFDGTETLTVMIRYPEHTEWRQARRKALVALARAGFRKPFGPAEKLPDPAAEPDYPVLNCWHWIEIENDPNLISALLWCAGAAEMPVTPRAGWGVFHSYIADLNAGTVLHVYDDRGMDVVATTTDALRPIYERFKDWLLDYDRYRMDQTFAT